MAIDVILTPFKRLILLILTVLYFAVLAFVFLRGLSEESYFRREDVHRVHDDRTPLGDDLNHLHVFVQISDLHLSIFRDRSRAPEFKDFCNHTVPIINPEVVLVTGDLTDAKYPNRQGSVQYEAEWKEYYRIITETKVLNKTVWLDIRGNHDDFDVPSYQSRNYFRHYSVQGQLHNSSYHYIHKSSDGDTTSFISFDACPKPGPRRPFNFFGVITENNLAQAEKFMEESLTSNMTVWFGHYPTSVLTGDVDRLRNIMSKGSVYLSGHLHTLGGFAFKMYSRQQAGYLELEVGDWMNNRIYRIFALDHGLFSFVDVLYNSWPVVLITNPKHGQFIIPHTEPLQRMLHSTHIRILAYSPASIVNVTVEVDDVYLGLAQHSGGALYVIQWESDKYARGQHKITVQVKDSEGREKILSQPFTLDETQIPFGYWPRFILMLHHTTEAKIMFMMAFIGTVLPMILTRIFNFSVDVGVSGSNCYSCMWLFQLMIRRYKILSNTPSVYWPLLAFHLYVAVGPWFIGEILKGYIGAMFVYGIYVNGTFIPGSLTFLYGFFQFLLFNFPLTQYLAHVLDQGLCKHKRLVTSTQHWRQICSWIFHHGLFVLMLLLQAYLAYAGTYQSYGLIAVLLCPVRTWSVVFALILQFLANKSAIPSYKPVKQTEHSETQF